MLFKLLGFFDCFLTFWDVAPLCLLSPLVDTKGENTAIYIELLWTGLQRKICFVVILQMIKRFPCQNISVSAPASSTDGSTALGINRLSANGRNHQGKHKTGISS